MSRLCLPTVPTTLPSNSLLPPCRSCGNASVCKSSVALLCVVAIDLINAVLSRERSSSPRRASRPQANIKGTGGEGRSRRLACRANGFHRLDSSGATRGRQARRDEGCCGAGLPTAEELVRRYCGQRRFPTDRHRRAVGKFSECAAGHDGL